MVDDASTVVRIPVKGVGTVLAGPVQEPDIDVVVELTLAQAVSGATVTTEVTRHSPCAECNGSGIVRAQGACAACSGSGVLLRHSGGIAIRQVCATCHGHGEAAPEQCHTCVGAGIASRAAPVTIRVPAGVQDGARLRVPKVGAVKRGPDGLAEGDLYALVKVAADPRFERRGADLLTRVSVTLAEAALGANIAVPTIEGDWLTVRVPPGTRHGRTLRVRGRGAPDGQARGNLLITVELDVPAELNPEQRAALEAFAAATTSSPRADMHPRPTAVPHPPPNHVGPHGGT